MFFFFFSSRRRHTRSKRDWSSDVCSSDLFLVEARQRALPPGEGFGQLRAAIEPIRRALIAFPLGSVIPDHLQQIGRASCRERVEISVVAVSLKKKNEYTKRYLYVQKLCII